MKLNLRLRKTGSSLTSILKKTLLFCFFICFIPAESIASQPQKNLSLELSNVSLITFFNTVEKESGYIFFFNKSVIDPNVKISVKANNEPVFSVLNRVLSPHNLTYNVKGRQIIVSKKAVANPVNTEQEETPAGYMVTGRVVDASSEPLPGVNISVIGSDTRTVSDIDGKFLLEVESGRQAELAVSYVGFETQRQVVSPSKTFIDITLKETPSSLNEVVVVGYGTQKKLNMTGAVASVSGDILNDRPIANVAQGLQGVIPNLNITFNSGQPNQPASYNIRGNTSLNGGSALILVDGVEISDLSLINPQDIDNISVLKDASTAAVYGPRGAFGVILITTKKGSNDKGVRINYNNNFSWNTPARLPDMPSADVWARAVNQMMDYDTPGDYYFSDRFLELLDAHIADPANNPGVMVDTEGIQDSRNTPSNPGWLYVSNTDWLKEFYRQAAFMQQHNVSISGGNERNNYYASLGYKDQSGIFRYGNDSYSRLNATFNYNTEITKWLDFGVNFKYNDMRSDEPFRDSGDGGSWYYDVYRMFPTMPVFLPNGDFAGITVRKGIESVIGKMANAGRKTDKTQDFWYGARFTLKPFKGFSIKGDFTQNQYYNFQKAHKKTIYQTMPDREGGLIQEENITPNGVTNDKQHENYLVFNIWAEYQKTFARDHNFQIMVGYNQEKKTYETSQVVVSDLFDNELPIAGMAETFRSTVETNKSWAVQGIFFRANYDYKSRYLLEINGRYDGSSKYAAGHKWGFFPSASIGWRISEESFMESAEWLDNLKIRASIGSLGNQVTDGYYQHYSYLTSSVLNYVMNGAIITGLNQPTLASSNITWEKVLSKNIGLDWNLFKNRLSGTFDFYVRDVNGMVRSRTYPAVLGASGGKENIADMRTTGWELEISWRDQIPNVLGSPFGYHFSVGLSDYQAEITKYDNPTGSLASGMYYEGQKLGEIWGYVTDGFIEDEYEASEMNYVQKFIYANWKPGDIRYKDLNGDGVIDKGNLTLDDHGDIKVIGNSTPRYRFNFQGGISWHNFDVRVMFEGVGKRDLWTDSDQLWGFSRGIYNSNIFQYHIDNTWSYTNTDAYFPRPSSLNHSKQIQTKYLQNAAYIRLKDVTVSYTLPQKWTEKLRLEQIRLYASGLNLWEKTGLPPFMTPDIVDNMVNSTGVNSGKEYAFMRSYSFGINITF